MKRVATLCLPCVVLLGGALTSAAPPGGTPVVVVNAGFEANPVAPNCFQVFTPTGWQPHDPFGILDFGSDVIGGLHPLVGGPWFQNGAPEGQHVGIVFLQGDIAGGEAGLRQTLASTLQLNTRYTLRVQVGDIGSGTGPPPCNVFGFFNLDGFPGYRVQLRAGGQLLAEDDNTLAATLTDRQFAESEVVFTTGAMHPQAGQPIEIRLINRNEIDTPMNPGIEVDFDAVRLWTGCVDAGDLDDNGDVNATDLQLFVDVLLGLDADAQHVERADADCSGQTDAGDAQPFVDLLLG